MTLDGRENENAAPSPLSSALDAHKSGRLDAAEALYRTMLSHPDNYTRAMALHGLGVTLFQRAHATSSSPPPQESLLLLDKAVELLPEQATFYNSRGIVLERLNKLDEALKSFESAMRFDPTSAKYLYNAGKAAKKLGQQDVAFKLLVHVIHLDPKHPEAHYRIGKLHKDAGRMTEALASFQRHLALCPEHAYARFWVAALTGGDEQDKVFKPEMIAKLFDDYAQTFDDQLRVVLQYRTPEVLLAELQAVQRAKGRANAPAGGCLFQRGLDLGCGTGLMGALVRDMCVRLEGVDLSRQMVEQAKCRGVYDALAVDEIVAHLHKEAARSTPSQEETDPGPPSSSSPRAKIDLFLAADVLVYVAELRPLFAAAAFLAHDEALFAFSTEKLLEGEDEQGVGYRLRPTGRFAHDGTLIARVCHETGWDIVRLVTTPIRMNLSEPVVGDVVVARRRR